MVEVADIYTASPNGTHPEPTFSYSFEMPGRRDDCPPPSGKTTRRLELPDGEHWFEVRGGGTQVEGAALDWAQSLLRTAVEARQALRARAEPRATPDELAAADAVVADAELTYNAFLATFIADRVVDHNLTDRDGDKLPVGLGLFWALPGADAIQLAFRIQRRESIWANPKAESESVTG